MSFLRRRDPAVLLEPALQDLVSDCSATHLSDLRIPSQVCSSDRKIHGTLSCLPLRPIRTVLAVPDDDWTRWTLDGLWWGLDEQQPREPLRYLEFN